MPRVRYKPVRSGAYSGPSGTWQPGDVREVSEKDAAWLLGPMSALFEAVEDAPPSAPAPLAPSPSLDGKKDRAYRGGKKK